MVTYQPKYKELKRIFLAEKNLPSYDLKTLLWIGPEPVGVKLRTEQKSLEEANEIKARNTSLYNVVHKNSSFFLLYFLPSPFSDSLVVVVTK